MLTAAGALALLTGAAAAADAHTLTAHPSAAAAVLADTVDTDASADCVGDAQGMMTMPDGMKMPVSQMPGCSAVAKTTPAAAKSTPAASPAATAKATAAPTAKATAPGKATPAPAGAKPAPAGAMPSADKGAVPKAAAAGTGGQAAAPQQVHAGTGGQAAAPQHVHAGTGGQASEGSSSTPLAPLGFVLAGAAVVAMAGRRLHRG